MSTKVVLVGDQGVGKTFLSHFLLTNQLKDNYFTTFGVEIHPINIHGKEFTFWDTGSIASGLKDGYYINADICIIMADSDVNISFDNYFENYQNDVKRISPNCKFINVINKLDLNDITYENAFHISVRENWGLAHLKNEIILNC